MGGWVGGLGRGRRTEVDHLATAHGHGKVALGHAGWGQLDPELGQLGLDVEEAAGGVGCGLGGLGGRVGVGVEMGLGRRTGWKTKQRAGPDEGRGGRRTCLVFAAAAVWVWRGVEWVGVGCVVGVGRHACMNMKDQLRWRAR